MEGAVIRRALFLGLACCALSSGHAASEPSIWDRAKGPEVEREQQALVAVERMLSRSDASPFDPQLQRNFMRAAVAMLELTGGERISDPRLLFLLGDLLSDSSVGRDKEARRLLERALRVAPDSPLAGRGWFNLAIVSARLGEPKAEHHAYTRALDTIWEPGFRANIYMNRGESSMVLGDLDRAIADYRRSIQLADRPDLQALAHFGLGIALERSGDMPAALVAMRTARAVQLIPWGSALDLPSVFFVPWYDIHYYKALAATSAARDAKQPKEASEHLMAAAKEWQDYLDPAITDGHRWVPNAKLHLADVMKRLKKLQPAAAKPRVMPPAAKNPAVR
jgi:tetratricopeptide (TPR) repeat protein